MEKEKNQAAVELGRKGGLAKSEKKAASSAENGKKGGKPTKEECDAKYKVYQKKINREYSDLIDGVYKAMSVVLKKDWKYGVDLLKAYKSEMKKLNFNKNDAPRFEALAKLIEESDRCRPNKEGRYFTIGPFNEDEKLGKHSINGLAWVFVEGFTKKG